MTILITLLGEQPIPNLLPLWQYGHYTQVRFAATQKTLPLANSLAGFIQADPSLQHLHVGRPVEVPPYDLHKARAALSRALNEADLTGEAVTLNLTGGTKLMSLAALQSAYGSGAQLLYVSTEQNQNIFMRSDGSEEKREPIRVRISIDQYMRAHGLETSANQNFSPAPGASPTEIGLKDGDALEVEVYKRARDSDLFDEVRRVVHIRKQINGDYVTNELDIVAIHNGRLVVTSCKSIKAENTKDFNAPFHEIASLSRREIFGIYCGKVMVMDKAKITKDRLQRAQSMGVQLVTANEMPNVAQVMRDSLR